MDSNLDSFDEDDDDGDNDDSKDDDDDDEGMPPDGFRFYLFVLFRMLS